MVSVAKTLQLRTSPHVTSGASVDMIMRHVVWALVPTALFGVYAFGLAAAVTLSAALASCLLAEWLLCKWSEQPSTLSDWSVAVTGLLYGLTLPPGLPVWMTMLGGFIAVGLGKHLFGGLGYNPFNPALVGRAVMQAAFPVGMTTWHAAFGPGRFSSVPSSLFTFPFAAPEYTDALTSATPLAAWKFEHNLAAASDLVMGFTTGSTGETSAVLILLGGAYLAARKMMNWRIPVAIFVTVAVLTGALHLASPEAYPTAPFMLLSGGLMLGAVFMATDMVASPMTTLGVVIYGALIGVLTVTIRLWGGMPEGVMYAILLANAVAPHIDRLVRPTVYGTSGRKA